MRIGIAVGVAFACAGCSRILGFEELGGTDATVTPPDTSTDLAADTPAGKLESRFVDKAVVEGSGMQVTLAIPAAIPASSFLVVEVAARGAPPVVLTDTAGHTWIKDAEIANSTDTSVVAIFHVRTVQDLGAGDEITASTNTTDSRTRGLALFALDNASRLDQVGTAQDSTTMPSVTTGSLAAGTALAFGVIVTGFNSPVTFAPQQPFLEVSSFSTPLSSASFDQAVLDNGSAQPASFATTPSSAANFGLAIATYR